MKILLSLVAVAIIWASPPGDTKAAETCFFGLFECGAGEVETVNTEDLEKFLERARVEDAADRSGRPVETTGSGKQFTGTSRTVNTKDGLQGYIIAAGYFINYSIIPLLIGIALLVFLFNMVRYFINSANLEEKEKARNSALYGIATFVAIVSIWGVVNLLVGGFGFSQKKSLCPDYLGSWCSDKSVSVSNTNLLTSDTGNEALEAVTVLT